MEKMKWWEIVGALLIIVLFLTPLVILYLVALLAFAFSALGWRNKEEPLHSLYLGIEISIIFSALFSLLFIVLISINNADPIGLFLVLPMMGIIVLLGIVVGLILGHKKKK